MRQCYLRIIEASIDHERVGKRLVCAVLLLRLVLVALLAPGLRAGALTHAAFQHGTERDVRTSATAHLCTGYTWAFNTTIFNTIEKRAMFSSRILLPFLSLNSVNASQKIMRKKQRALNWQN